MARLAAEREDDGTNDLLVGDDAAADFKMVHFGSEDWARVGLRDGEVTRSARREVCRLGSRGTTVP